MSCGLKWAAAQRRHQQGRIALEDRLPGEDPVGLVEDPVLVLEHREVLVLERVVELVGEGDPLARRRATRSSRPRTACPGRSGRTRRRRHSACPGSGRAGCCRRGSARAPCRAGRSRPRSPAVTAGRTPRSASSAARPGRSTGAARGGSARARGSRSPAARSRRRSRRRRRWRPGTETWTARRDGETWPGRSSVGRRSTVPASAADDPQPGRREQRPRGPRQGAPSVGPSRRARRSDMPGIVARRPRSARCPDRNVAFLTGCRLDPECARRSVSRGRTLNGSFLPPSDRRRRLGRRLRSPFSGECLRRTAARRAAHRRVAGSAPSLTHFQCARSRARRRLALGSPGTPILEDARDSARPRGGAADESAVSESS